MKFFNIFKSKTIDLNIIAGAVVTLLTSFGVVVPIEVVTGVFTIGNFILRFFTKKPVMEK